MGLYELEICLFIGFDQALVVVEGLFLLVFIVLNLVSVIALKWEGQRICHLKLSFEHSVVEPREVVPAIYQMVV